MKKSDIIAILVVGVLLIFSLITYNKVAELQQRLQVLDNLQHEVFNINHSVENVSSQVNMKLDEFLQEQLWIQGKNYEIANVDFENNEIEVTLEWSLRNLEADENVSFLYRAEGDSEWTMLEVHNQDGLNYSLQHTFPLRGNYETQVLATSTKGQRSDNLLLLNFKEQLDTRVYIHAMLQPLGNNGEFDMNIDIQNHLNHDYMITKKSDDFKIKKATAYLLLEGVVVEKWDLLEENHHREQFADDYNETIYFHDFISLGDEYGKITEDIQLRVVVEDHLGLKYERNADVYQ